MTICKRCSQEEDTSNRKTNKYKEFCSFCIEVMKKSQRNQKRSQKRFALRQKVNQLKQGPCDRCGQRDLPVYAKDFNHIDPTQKTAEISDLVRNLSPYDRILEEIALCNLLCGTCHKIVTYHQLQERMQSHRDALGVLQDEEIDDRDAEDIK